MMMIMDKAQMPMAHQVAIIVKGNQFSVVFSCIHAYES